MDRLIDTHAHLEQIDNLAEVLKRAKKEGVCAVVAVSVDLKSSEAILKVSRDTNDIKIYPAIGVHPSDCEKADLGLMLKLIDRERNNIIAIGETGLDFWYKQARKEGPGRKRQIDFFRAQLEIAKKYDLPVIIHSRGAWKECFDMVVTSGIERTVFHWYSGPQDVLEGIIKTGYFISATPAAEYSKEHQAAIERTPVEQLLVETDSPVRFKPQTGEYMSQPTDVARAVCAVAKIKRIEETAAAQKTTENAVKFFGLNGK